MVTLKEALNGKLTAKQLALVPSAFDIVGDLAIFAEFSDTLKSKEKLIADTLLNMHSQLRVVLKKTGKYSGRYRTPKLKILAGERRKETMLVESGCRFKLHAENTYYSVRSGTERKRIYSLVKTGERVLVMFSGIGAYPVTMAKHSMAKEIVGIEINPIAHQYGLENLKLNKIENVSLIEGDVMKELPRLTGTYDRILMPLPRDAERFLDIALSKAAKGTVIHFYSFGAEDGREAKLAIKEACRVRKKECRILRVVKCGSFGPGISRISVDFRIV
ncbi:MAG: class I SAM-dependent methyltransferase family protein [Nanoarchaeota archaeon]|nr:class I SAM-dependent methyltransferase family protein [Nanoarchaeota archaeon]